MQCSIKIVFPISTFICPEIIESSKKPSMGNQSSRPVSSQFVNVAFAWKQHETMDFLQIKFRLCTDFLV